MHHHLLVILFASLLLNSLNHGALDHSNIIDSACATTLYPDICFSTVSDMIMTQNIATKKGVIEHTINKTKDTIQANFNHITNLTSTANVTKRAKTALDDCLDIEAETLEQLDSVIHHLSEYPNKRPLRHYANDLKTIMSTTITNKETCLDGLSYNDEHCNWLRKLLIKGQEHGRKMCSNVLAMIKDMTDTDIANNPQSNPRRRLLKNKNKIMWPEWLSAGDRKLLASDEVTRTVIVSKDGKGNYTSVQEAVEAAPSKSDKRYVIKIMAGTYKEYVHVQRSLHNIMLIGEGIGKTIITGNKNVAANDGITTKDTATVAAMGDGFLARDITFENTAGPKGEQAVALRVGADLSAFYKCSMEGYQDTLYVHVNRQFYVKCLVTGTIDFIFGNAAAVFQFCDIMVRKPNPNQINMVTAQGKTDTNQDTGIVIHECNIGATADFKPVQGNFSTYLGRPWKKYSTTVVMRSTISDVINKEGWAPWDGDFGLDTSYYREYQNTGPGADTSRRVTWKGWGVIKDPQEAQSFTVARFINGEHWLPSTGFPFCPGL